MLDDVSTLSVAHVSPQNRVINVFVETNHASAFPFSTQFIEFLPNANCPGSTACSGDDEMETELTDDDDAVFVDKEEVDVF
ncbi:hypothetical protein F0562_011347 [Nyssa sinensis]|uniref:Uncharacterized protein n=1 Tax=Nyssa sinensis TaxID=561372 RepID=A0A5J5A1Q9_9ASTE|nr:hypothetical protein F0562_011347 [Nyssa sinensis]